VQHQTYTFRIETNPPGGLTPGSARPVLPGEQLAYAGILDAVSVIRGVKVRDVVPDGMTPAPGSIRMVQPDGTVIPVPDSAYDPVTRTIAWPETTVTAGETRFEMSLIVEPLGDGEVEKDYEIGGGGGVTVGDGDGGEKSTAGDTGYFDTSIGFSEIVKTAALIANNAAQAPNAGAAGSPVLAGRGQQVEYRLTVTRDAGAKNRSGRIVISDALPAGMALAPGSVQGTVSGQGRIVSMNASQVADVDGVSKPGVQWMLEGLADGDVAELSFRASFPESADDPATETVEMRLDLMNTARLVDESLRNLRYARSLSGRPAGTNVYAKERYDKASNATYHYILGPRVEAVKSSDVPAGNRVYERDLLTYTIVVRNTGEDAASNLLVRDEISPYTAFVSGSQSSSRSDAEFAQEGGVIGWIIPALAPGETVTLSFRARVTRFAELGSRLIRNTAVFGESKPGADPRGELLTGDYLVGRSNEVTHVQRQGATVTVRKVDSATGAPLAGAEFVLRQVSAYAAHDAMQDQVAVSGRNGEAVFRDVPMGKYTVIERTAPEGYIASDVRRSIDLNGSSAERTIVVPNRSASGTSSQSNFGDEERERNWSALLELIMDVGVPNAGAGSRNVGDAPQ
jgi:uncharacterized repeat protein (TIGR01451 family)